MRLSTRFKSWLIFWETIVDSKMILAACWLWFWWLPGSQSDIQMYGPYRGPPHRTPRDGCVLLPSTESMFINLKVYLETRSFRWTRTTLLSLITVSGFDRKVTDANGPVKIAKKHRKESCHEIFDLFWIKHDVQIKLFGSFTANWFQFFQRKL